MSKLDAADNLRDSQGGDGGGGGEGSGKMPEIMRIRPQRIALYLQVFGVPKKGVKFK